MSIESAEQRWKTIREEWGIERRDIQPLKSKEALETLEVLLAEEDMALAVRASQMLLTDPEDSKTRERVCFEALCQNFSEEVWTHPWEGERAAWMLQGLLVAAWPDGGLATDVAALFETAWLGRASIERQQKGLDGWRQRVAIATLDRLAQQNFTAESRLQVTQSGIQKALTQLTEYAPQGVAFNLFGPPLRQALSALREDILLVADLGADKKHVVGTSKHVARLEGGSASENWTFNHYAGDLLAVLKPMANVCHYWGYSVSWEHLNWLKANAGSPHTFQVVSGRIIDVVNAIVHAVRLQWRLANLVDVAKESSQGDLLWWGQAGYSYFLRKPFRKIENHARRMLFMSVEAAERSRTLPAEPSAAYLVQTMTALGLDVAASRTLGQWMETLYEALDDLESRENLQMATALAELVDEDPLGLPVSFVRRLVEKKDSLSPDEAHQRVGLDLQVQIDQGDWASWIYRECRLDLMFREDG